METIVHGCSAFAPLSSSKMYVEESKQWKLKSFMCVLALAHPLEESSEQYVPAW